MINGKRLKYFLSSFTSLTTLIHFILPFHFTINKSDLCVWGRVCNIRIADLGGEATYLGQSELKF